MKTAYFLLIALACWPVGGAEPARTPIVLAGVQDGSYVLTVRGGVVTLTPAIVVSPGGIVIPVPPTPPVPPVPPGPDPPVPPPAPVTSGVAYLIVMRPDQPTESQAADLMLLRQWIDSQPAGKAEMLELTKDQRDPAGGLDSRVAGYVALIPPGEQLPYVFLIQAKTDGSGNFTHWRGELDGNREAIIDRIKGVLP